MDERRFPRAAPADGDKTVVGRLPTSSPPRPGTVLANTYRLEARLPRRGIGETWRARHVELGSAHAITIVPPLLTASPEFAQRLIADVRRLSAIRSDAIVTYEGLLRDDQGLRFVVAEWVDGPTLRELLAGRRLEPPEVLRLRDRLAQALGAAHERGIMHGNLSPDCIVLPDGDVARAKLGDFEIARSAASGDATRIGMNVLAEFAYASPEQMGLSGGRVDSRTDIYSLGLVLAEAAIGFGKSLDMGQNPASMIAARRRVPDLTAVPEQLRAVIAPLLEPMADNRPASVRALTGDAARAPTGPTSPASPAPRWRVIAIAAGIAAVVAVAVGVVAVRLTLPAPSREELASSLDAATGGYNCAALTYAVAADRSVNIAGRVASLDDRDRLRRDITAIRGLGPATFEVAVMGPPHCQVADLLGPLAAPKSPTAPMLRLDGDGQAAHMGDRLRLDVRAPLFDGYVYIDYFDRGGQVLHLFPNSRDFFNYRPARNDFVVFKPPLVSCWAFNGSVGQELIGLIVTKKPLFPTPRPEIEKIDDYLAGLAPALRAVADGDAVAATLVFNLENAAPWSGNAAACPSG